MAFFFFEILDEVAFLDAGFDLDEDEEGGGLAVEVEEGLVEASCREEEGYV